MGAKRVEMLCRGYLHLTVPAEAGEVQREETERAFWAGATALFGLIISLLEPGQEATDADIAVMSEIERELTDFAAALKAGASH